MGTSKSSDGSPSGADLVPPWATGTPGNEPEKPPAGKAPDARFQSARARLNRFAREGTPADMRAGLGRYVKGHGGSSTAARRMGRASATAASLTAALAAFTRGETVDTPSGQVLDPASLRGMSARDVTSLLADAFGPITGDQDGEVSRMAIDEALSELLEVHPDADLTALTEQQIQEVTGLYLSEDIYTRVCLDVGKSMQLNAPSAEVAARRFEQIREYIREIVSDSLRRLPQDGNMTTATELGVIVSNAIAETCRVFEEYA